MQRYIAFLSGIPLDSDSAAMQDLRRSFAQLGFLNVETVRATGNITFDTAPAGLIRPLEEQISRHLHKTFGETVDVFLRTAEHLEGLLKQDAFPREEVERKDTSMFVVFLHEPPDETAQRKLKYAQTESDAFYVRGEEILWLRHVDPHNPTPPPAIGEILDAPATVRTFNTIRQLVSKREKTRDSTASAQSRL